MSSLIPTGNRKDQKLVVGGIPRADLLPPEIKQDEKAGKQRRGMLAILVLVLIVVALAYAGSTLVAQVAQNNLLSAQDKSATLLSEQAKYVEVRTLKAKVEAAKTARLMSVVTEIDWKKFLKQIDRSLPGGAKIEEIQLSSISPIGSPDAATSPLEDIRMAEMTIDVTTSSRQDIAKWLERLKAVTGYEDARPVVVDTDDGDIATQVVLHINLDALSNRYLPETVEETE